MLVQVSFAFTNISWFLSRMSCIFCVIKILVFSSMQFSRYTRMRARLKLESCGMLAFLSDYKFKCIGTQCHDRGSCASEVRIRYFRFTRYPGLPLEVIRQPPALPCRLQHSTIGRPGLNHRVRDGNGCVPWAHRHRKSLSIFLQICGQIL